MRGQFPIRIYLDAPGKTFRAQSILARTILLRQAILTREADRWLKKFRAEGSPRIAAPAQNIAVFADRVIEDFWNANKGLAPAVFNAIIRNHLGG